MNNNDYRITRHPILIGALIVWAGWLVLMISGDHWRFFKTDWFMSVTMAFGSFIAGATSEGGGAVAFPVMTLLFGIKPHIARDFSLMIQSVGMMAATFTIICLKIPVEWRAILYAGIGGVIGVAIGIDVISPLMSPAYTKIFFTSTWLSFAAALYWINRYHDREVHIAIANFAPKHIIVLIVIGVIGGAVSGITGSGLDIVTFSLLVLSYRINEKIATPTSVVLMGMNALAGFIWKEGFSGGMAADAWQYWYVCIPIVVLGAPAGAWFIKNRSRLFIAGFLYFSVVVQYIAALIILPINSRLIIFSLSVLAIGVLFFHQMSRFGERRLVWLNNNKLNSELIAVKKLK